MCWGKNREKIGLGTNEVLKNDVGYIARATIALDHHHLVRVPGVDIAVDNVADVGAGTEGSDGTSATGVAVDVLDQEVVGVGLLRLELALWQLQDIAVHSPWL